MLHYFSFFQFFLPVFPWLRGFFNIGRLIFGKVKYYRRYELIKTEIQRKPVLCLFFILTKELALQDLAAFHGTEDITFEWNDIEVLSSRWQKERSLSNTTSKGLAPV